MSAPNPFKVNMNRSNVLDPIVGGMYKDDDGKWWQCQSISRAWGSRSFYFKSIDEEYAPVELELSPRDRPRPRIRKTTPPR